MDDLVLVASGLGPRAFAKLEDPAVRASLARMINAIPPFVPWCVWSDPLETRGFPVEATRPLVRELVAEIIAVATSVEVVAAMLEIPWLILDEDAFWIADNALDAVGTQAAATWSTLLVRVVTDFGGVPARYLLDEGFTSDEVQRIGNGSKRLVSSYSRSRPREDADRDDKDAAVKAESASNPNHFSRPPRTIDCCSCRPRRADELNAKRSPRRPCWP